MAMASDIAFYVGQWNTDGWYDESQFEDVETIIAETGHLFGDIQQFDDYQFYEFGAWVDQRMNDGKMDIIWLNGCTPSVLYPNPNEQPDGSRAEKWLDGGNMIINVGDWFGYCTYEGGPRGGEGRGGDNGGDGAANILDLPYWIIVFGDGTQLTVTPTGKEYLPSLNNRVKSDRPVLLTAVQAPWEVAAIFASTGGTDDPGAEAQADPVVIHNTDTGGYVAFINQAGGGPAGWIDDRGLTCAEFIGNWVNNVIGLGDQPLAAVEDFESNNFSTFPWEHHGDASWTIISHEKHSGTYSAQAGTIDHDESTTLQVRLRCVSGDITFYHKVSSESGCDYLEFYLDGIREGRWSGTMDWEQVSFPVMTGTRTFEWTYSKDGSVSSDGDTAWIDDIVFPVGSGTIPKGEVIELTDAAFDQIVLSSNVPVLVDFWAPWCGPCLIMAPVIEEIADEYAGRIKVCKLNVDNEPRTTADYEIRFIPTFILFKDGQAQRQWVGVTGKNEITAAIDELL